MTSQPRISTCFFAFSGLFLLSIIAAIWTSEYLLFSIPFALLVLYTGWHHIGLVFFLLVTSLAFSFEYNFSPTLGTDIPDEGLMLVTSFLFISYWLYNPSTISNQGLNHPLFLLLLLQVCWMIICTVTSSFPLLSFKFLLAKSWYLGSFVLAPLILFRDKRMIRLTAILLAGSMVIIACVALVRHAAYSFSFADINKAVAPFFRNHVTYSSMLVCLLPLFFAIFFLTKNRRIRFGIAFIVFILLTALFFSYARGAWLALLTGLITYWLVKKKRVGHFYVATILIGVVALFWLKSNDRYLHYAHDYKTTIYHEDFRQHLVATYKLKDVSTAERFYRWIAGIRMIKENPVTGFGPATFYENYKPYGIPAFRTWVSDNEERSTVHNYFLLLAIEQGYPGLVFFLLMLGAMFFFAQRVYHRSSDPFDKITAISIAVMLAMISTVNFLSDLIETDKIGSLFFLCLATLIMLDVRITRKSESPTNI